MRTFKFRAWDEKTKQFIATGFHLLGEVMAFNIIEGFLYKNLCGEESVLERWNDVIIQQFTGLFDRNGKEIYEGDICEVEEYEGCPKVFGEIIWGCYSDHEYVENLECWIFKQKHQNSPLSCVVKRGVRYSRGLETIPDTLQVIGNIYENPELLKNE